MRDRQEMVRIGKLAYRMCLRLWFTVVIIATGLSAQVPDQLPASQTRSNQTALFGLPQQQGQYPVCTPAEYGDPTAECIPSDQKSLYSPYGSYNDISGLGSFPGVNNTVPYPSSYPTQFGDSRESSREVSSSSHYVKEPPTEFQRYVAAATGQMLPIFGASLFEGVPATFAPLDRSPVGSDYVIAPGDELQLTIWGQLNL